MHQPPSEATTGVLTGMQEGQVEWDGYDPEEMGFEYDEEDRHVETVNVEGSYL